MSPFGAIKKYYKVIEHVRVDRNLAIINSHSSIAVVVVVVVSRESDAY